MKIPTKQLKAFNSAAGSMRQNSILPILSFLKLDKRTITKNNLEAFITMDIDFEGSYLIDEKILMGFIESVDAEEIDIWFTVIYGGMVAEENKEFAVLKKRIKRLGMHQILIERKDAEYAANFSKGKKWKELDELMKKRGF